MLYLFILLILKFKNEINFDKILDLLINKIIKQFCDENYTI